MSKLITERKWLAISPRPFTADGGKDGEVTLTSTLDFKVKQIVNIRSGTQSSIRLEVKRVLSLTVMLVGPKSNDIGATSDLTAYLTADGATIRAPEQGRASIPPTQHENAVYAEEPIIAKRVIQVDEEGNYYNDQNPFPIDIQTVTIPSIDVALTHRENFTPSSNDADSVRIGNGVAGRTLEIYPNKDIDIRRIGTTINEKLKTALLCMEDVIRALTWAEINGVRKITKIEWTSSALDTQESGTIKLTRNFTYQGIDPFDLTSINDVLTV